MTAPLNTAPKGCQLGAATTSGECTAERHGSVYAYNAFGCRCPDASARKVRSNKAVELRKLAGRPGLVDATGTRRRLQALHALGWRSGDLAYRLGVSVPSVRQYKWRELVQRRIAQRIAALYDELAEQPGPSTLLAKKAAGWGWLPPKWWDDDTIDDPTYEPPVADVTHWSDVDPVAVERAADGDAVPLTRAERVTAALLLRDRGLSQLAIAKRLRVHARQVARDLADHEQAS